MTTSATNPSGRPPHDPVLLERVVGLLSASGPGLLIDATVGAGGHASALLEASGPDVVLLGLDRDPDALELAERSLAPYGSRAVLAHAGYDTIAAQAMPLLETAGPLLGVLYDLGVSSMQLDRPERGFSFSSVGPLDMRMDPTDDQPTAAELVNTAEQADLARILSEGEERFARRVAAAIVRARPLRTTSELADVVRGAVPSAARHGRVHPATRTFQALRIAVNAELNRFRASLPQALELAAPATTGPPRSRGGRVAVIAYHSLEDRIAKQAFAAAAHGCVCPPDLPRCGCGRAPSVRGLTRGGETPAQAEVAANPRARSARLRAVEAVGP